MTKTHWEKIYSAKQPHEVSWTQDEPTTSLDFIQGFHLPRTAGIIDIGGGESKLVDRLLDMGYKDITVLDISEHALERTKQRLDHRTRDVRWIVADVTEFRPDREFALWHDRAAFHFLTDPEQVALYLRAARSSVSDGGFLVLGTFSDHGPTKCSGLQIRQYSEETMERQLSPDFRKIRCITEDHRTPFGTLQNFLFCGFQKIDHR